MFLGALGLYVGSRPTLPNGDGVGYVRAARTGQLAPGHPAYVPILSRLGEPKVPRAQLLSALLGALGVAVVAWRVGAIAACGLAVSFGYLAASADIEVYAAATLALILVLCLRGRALRALFAGVAIAFHLEHVMLLPFLLVECGFATCAAAALTGGAAYGIAAFGVLHLHPGEAIHWVLSSRHGFGSPLWKAPAGAVFGAARTLAVAPYPYEAAPARVFFQSVVGALGLLALLWAARREPAPLGLPRRSLYALVIPYAAFGILFFPTDPERWLFLLPLFWMWTQPALARAPRLAAAGLAVLLLFNFAFGVLPGRDTSAREKIDAARQALRAGDLVIAPGHGWDEYLDLDGPLPKDSQLVLLAYFAGLDGPERALARVRTEAQSARRVLLLRFFEDADPQGWKELHALGVTAARVRAALGGGPVERLAPDVYALVRTPSRFGRWLPTLGLELARHQVGHCLPRRLVRIQNLMDLEGDRHLDPDLARQVVRRPGGAHALGHL
jgi:hypothetical protein